MTSRRRSKIAATDTELNALLEELEYRKDVEEARAALEEVEREGTVPWDEIKTELGI